MNTLFRKKNIALAVGLAVIGAIYIILYRIDADRTLYLTVSWMIIVLILVILSNRFLNKKLNKRLPWLSYGNKRFYWQLASEIIISLVIINLSYLVFKYFLTQDPPDASQLTLMNIFGTIILIPIISINFGIQFLKNWKNAQLDSEKFQKESIKAELTTLKNHLDPHFLFNNLNILSSLISKDQKKSQEYLEKFAEVYRIILQSSSEELVPLKQELDFIKAYMYLLHIRFEDTIQLEMDIPTKNESYYLPPLTLQMLIENAIKHNVTTEIRPLKIDVGVHAQYLIIKNNLQPKKVAPGQSNKSGLKNIERRYSYFTDRKVNIHQTPEKFIVKVPLIDITSI